MEQGAVITACNGRLDDAEVLRLYSEAAPLIRSLGARLLGPDGEADDLLHDVFVIACHKRGVLAREAALSFLCSTAVKVAAGMRRRARVRRWFGMQAPASSADYRTPDRDFDQRNAVRIVYGILDRIPEKRRVVFILHEIQGMSGPEIADVLGVPVNTVWSRLKKIRREFSEQLGPWREVLPARAEARR